MVVTFAYPPSQGIPHSLHYLRNLRIVLEGQKQGLERVNETLLGDEPPPIRCYDLESRHLWEKAAWKEFEAMSAEERRPIVDKICSDGVEHNRQEIETVLRTICQLEKKFNKLEPKHKRKKLGGRMFSPPHKGSKTKKSVNLDCQLPFE